MKQLLLIFVCFFLLLFQMNGQGELIADYYNGINFQEYVGSQTVSNIDFYWNQEAPIADLDPNYCSVLFTGQLRAPRSGVVFFSARVDDGIELWIDDTLVMSNWQLNDVGYSSGKIHLEADTNYNIKVKYFNAMREAELKLLWKLPIDPEKSWYNRLWEDNQDPILIAPQYFSAPLKHKQKA